MEYNPQSIERKWRDYWEENEIYRVSNESDKPKYYVLDMFPYPSGAGLHVGHPLGYIASDIFSRYKRMKGFNVLHPMGYDAFGLPAEQYAIETGIHPAVSTDTNIKKYRSQMDNLGFSFDWSREYRTSDADFYKWTQWIFQLLFDHYYDTGADKAKPISYLVAHFETTGSKGVKAANENDKSFTGEEWKAMSPIEQSDILTNFRLAFRKVAYVNWCEVLGTVLANDEVKDGVSERGGHPVEKRPMLQWSLRITAYAQRLLDDLQTIDWPEPMKTIQTNWMGRSEGAQMFFDLDGHDEQLEIYTTRPDTIFGATYMVLAPEHPLVDKITTDDRRAAVTEYLEYTNSRSERERMTEVKEVTGCFLGAYAKNPFTNNNVPIYIGEYVLMDYGTGAIMAVPSDDDRDFAFATKFGLPIIDVIDKSKYPGADRHDKLGIMINSGFLNDMEVPAAISLMLEKIEERGIGQRQVNFRLRDATFSRQRYWGEPIPILYDSDGVPQKVDLNQLPVELPPLDNYQPTADGRSPLARVTEWVNQNGMTRETDTMPGYAGSSWYYLRYMDAKNHEAFASKSAVDYWQQVDLYIGGPEHGTGHLMYSRFWHKFLYDLGYVPTPEPFKKLINQGMIQGVIEFLYLSKSDNAQKRFLSADQVKDASDYARIPVFIDFVSDYGSTDSYLSPDGIKQFVEWRSDYADAIFVTADGEFKVGAMPVTFKFQTHSEVGKMSKRYFNVVNPDDVVDKYGADCFRMYEMFLGPLEHSKPWDTKGIDGVSKFLRRLWNLFFDKNEKFSVSDEAASPEELKILHTVIKKINSDIDRFSFNTCISAFMVATNDLKKVGTNKRAILEPLVRLIAPFAPHVAEELWNQLGNEGSVTMTDFPIHDEQYLVENSITYPISINGKKRMTADFPADMSKEDLEKAALGMEEMKKWIEGKEIRKVIVVPKRMINIVV